MKTKLKRLQPLVGITISVILVYLVLFSPKVSALFSGEMSLPEALFGDPRIGLEDLRAAGDQLVAGYAFLAVGMLILSLFLRAWRWRIIIKEIGPAGYWTVYHGVNLGYLLNNILPLRAGELLRAVIVANRSALSPAAVTTTVVAERVFDLAGLGILFGMTAFLYPFPDWLQTGGLIFAVVVVGFLAAAMILAYNQKNLEQWHDAFARRGKLVRKLGSLFLSFVDGLAVLRSKAAMINVAWSTLALWAIYVSTMKFVFDAFQFTNGDYAALIGQAWIPAMALTVITSLGFSIPSAPGGVGTYHGAVLLGLSWFGVDEGMGVIFATVVHAMNYLTLTLFGVISLLVMRLKFSDLTKQTRRAGEPPHDTEQVHTTA